MGKKRKKKKVLLSGSDPFYLSKKLRRRRYGEVSPQTSQKSQNRALVKKKVAYRAPAAQACTPPTWTINRIFSKSEILAESLPTTENKKKTHIPFFFCYKYGFPHYYIGLLLNFFFLAIFPPSPPPFLSLPSFDPKMPFFSPFVFVSFFHKDL